MIDTREPALRGLPADHVLDGIVFTAAARPFARVMVGGRWCQRHDDDVAARFETAMQELW